jgi:hypothetical protein
MSSARRWFFEIILIFFKDLRIIIFRKILLGIEAATLDSDHTWARGGGKGPPPLATFSFRFSIFEVWQEWLRGGGKFFDF